MTTTFANQLPWMRKIAWAGVAMAAFGLMRRLEARLGIPVLTANQVTLWQALRLAGARVFTDQYGRLFALQKAGR